MPGIFQRVLGVLLALLVIAGTSFAVQKRPASSSGRKKPAAAAKKHSSSTHRTSTRKSRSRRSRPRVRGQLGPTPQRIKEIQAALARSGQYQKDPSGQVDAATAAALTRFQAANGLEPTGKITVRTLRLLEKYGLPPNSYSTAALAPEPTGAMKQ